MLDQDVQSRVDAYRGNPQALQQKYSVSKDLLDLMALQKLTKEKEAATRELQMAMAAKQGQGPGTIRDQLQQKALGMTKQELEQQQMQLLQQKQQEQQQNLQQLAQSGIAQNPAPNMEDGPGFASGGIIAFAGGAEVPFANPMSDVNVAREKVRRGEPLTEREENALRNAERAMLRAFGPNQNVINPPAQTPTPLPADLARQAEKKIPLSEAEKIVGNIGKASAPGYNGPNPLDEKRALNRGVQLPPNAPTAYPMPGMTPKEVILDTAQRAGILSPPPSAETKPAPEQTRLVRPAPAVAPVGIATPPVAPPAPQAAQQPAPSAEATVQQPAAPQAAPAENEFVTRLKADLDQAQENPGAARQNILQQFLAQHGLTPEERADRTKYQEALRARHAALTDPEELRREKLKQTLLGMAGASNAGLAFARGAAAGQNYEAGRNAEALKTLEQLQGINEGETAARRKALETAYGFGGKEAESVRGSETARYQAGLGALGGLARTDKEIAAQERLTDKKIKAELERTGLDNASRERVVDATNQTSKEVARIHGQFANQAAGIHAAASKYSSDAQTNVAYARLIEDSRSRLTASLAKTHADIERAITAPHKGLYDAIALTGKATPEQQKQLNKIDADIQLAKTAATNTIQNELDRLGLSKYGIGVDVNIPSGGSSGGFKLLGTRPQ